MPNESFANAPLVEIGGRPLSAPVAHQLAYTRVEGSLNLPDSCLLRFRDPHRGVLADAGIEIGATVTVKVNTSEPGAPVTLMTGEITAVELDIDVHGSVTEVRGLDLAHRLCRGRRTAAYPDMSIPDVVRKVCSRAGLTVGTVDPVPGGGRPHTQLSQRNQSDWEFLTDLADTVGAQVTASEGRLHFRLPRSPAAAPGRSASATSDPLVLEEGRNLISLRASMTATAQVPQVEVRGWDYEHKQPLSATAVPAAVSSEVPAADPVGLANRFGAAPLRDADPARHDPKTLQATADGLAELIGDAAVELDGVARGNPRLLPGAAVALSGVGEPFTGKYTLATCRHVFGELDGYTTAFTVSGRRVRSLTGITDGDRPVPAAPFTGLVPAVVTDVRDPLALGRVKLTFPWLAEDFTSGWARTVQQGAGADRGALLLPEVGDEVLAGFAMGDLNSPYVLGGLYNGEDAPPALGVPVVDGGDGRIAVRGWVSRTGHRVELVDAPDGAGVLVATGDGGLKLRLDPAGKTIELLGDGPVKVTGVGVTVDAGTGVLELKGQSVKLTGQTSVEVSGQQVKVAAQATGEVSASGQLTVRGGIVKIN
ncbi:uncharacterized protein involved in type VI secretion and phage assembly [Stackebrandtia albiflava]|uniref:Uncharacterized protein involved in type VI secretion and phage assembly n=1 Tax=Stackebrandtia albiflava TaxID=406432 RepID=A0A562UPW7_9ACTN|nr:VgrG-related protein [Stackebrandtia albiflava]TWJ07660.1 uncharacterized protein involved in type VI secretion and phage assembly [Stackebrandtia albiflava]